MQGGSILVSGHSGVGKSTLLNALIPGLDQKTAEVSDVHDKGRHTTTFRGDVPYAGGQRGFIIDTPGIKGFGLVRIEKETLHHHFPEMFRLLPRCKFHNCRHLDEPGCAVRKALETGRWTTSATAITATWSRSLTKGPTGRVERGAGGGL